MSLLVQWMEYLSVRGMQSALSKTTVHYAMSSIMHGMHLVKCPPIGPAYLCQ